MTFEPLGPADACDCPFCTWELDNEPQPAENLTLVERFKRYLASRRAAGLGHRDPGTAETERLLP